MNELCKEDEEWKAKFTKDKTHHITHESSYKRITTKDNIQLKL